MLECISLISLANSTLEGWEMDVKYPDFVISKPVPTEDGKPRYKHILAILEIKKINTVDANSLSQLMHYSVRTSGMPHTQLDGGIVPSYLVAGPQYTQL